MNSIIRAASRLILRPGLSSLRLVKPIATRHNLTQIRWAHNFPTTYDFTRERIMLVLRLFDKIDGEKLTLDSHFQKDLGLDSLDHVELIVQIEDEFLFEIPDKDAEMLVTPRDILTYITDHEEAYEELQKLQAEHHHHGPYVHHLIKKPEGHGDHHHHDEEHHASHTIQSTAHADSSANLAAMNHQQTRHLSTFSRDSRRYLSDKKKGHYQTSFGELPPKEVNLEDIQQRVMKVCSKYDKIDSSQLQLGSHFVQDLGLDSLDHVEVMMELEDEFGLEIPDKDAEKLMRPAEIAAYIFRKEEARAQKIEERPY